MDIFSNMDMTTYTTTYNDTTIQGPGRFDISLDSIVNLYKQEQENLKKCREIIIQFEEELAEKDSNIRKSKSLIGTSTRYINRLESVNVGLRDNLIEERTKTKSLEEENRELKLELKRLVKKI